MDTNAQHAHDVLAAVHHDLERRGEDVHAGRIHRLAAQVAANEINPADVPAKLRGLKCPQFMRVIFEKAAADIEAGGARAADLPDGSVVYSERTTYVKDHPLPHAPWRGTRGGYHADWEVDKALDGGGEVVRVGKSTPAVTA